MKSYRIYFVHGGSIGVTGDFTYNDESYMIKDSFGHTHVFPKEKVERYTQTS